MSKMNPQLNIYIYIYIYNYIYIGLLLKMYHIQHYIFFVTRKMKFEKTLLQST